MMFFEFAADIYVIKCGRMDMYMGVEPIKLNIIFPLIVYRSKVMRWDS